MICVSCKLSTHEGHTTCGFEKAAQQEKQKLNKLLSEVKNRAGEYGKIMEDWRKYEGELNKHRQILKVRHRVINSVRSLKLTFLRGNVEILHEMEYSYIFVHF